MPYIQYTESPFNFLTYDEGWTNDAARAYNFTDEDAERKLNQFLKAKAVSPENMSLHKEQLGNFKLENFTPATKALTDDGTIRKFASGATRDTSAGKLDFEGFIDPKVLECYARFMDYNRLQTDGKVRDSDNWQKGIPEDVCVKCEWRHFFAVWMAHRGYKVTVGPVWHQLAVMFNAMAYIRAYLKEHPDAFEAELIEAVRLRDAGQKP